jgi:hypothetical protein
VVWVCRLAWRDLPQAETKPLSADLAADASAPTLKTRLVAVLIELGIVEVRHSLIVEGTLDDARSVRASRRLPGNQGIEMTRETISPRGAQTARALVWVVV